jgi:hypothetical protein
MTDILLGGPPIPLYDFDNLEIHTPEYHDEIYDIIHLLGSQYEISDSKIKYAYEAFVKATGYNQTFLENNANIIKDAQIGLTSATTLYVSLLVGITLIIIIWVFCLIGLYNWIIALILTVVIVFFIFIMSFAYSSKCDRIINEESSKLKAQTEESLGNFKNSIPHWPKGLYEALLTIIDDPKHMDEQKDINDLKSINNSNNIDIKKGCGCNK